MFRTKSFYNNAPVKDYVTSANVLRTSYDISYSSFRRIFDRIDPISTVCYNQQHNTVNINTLGEHSIQFSELSEIFIRERYEEVMSDLMDNGFAADASVLNSTTGIGVSTISGRETVENLLKGNRGTHSKLAELLEI